MIDLKSEEQKMRKFLSRMRVVGGSLAMNLKDAATFYPENFSTQGINELVEKWNSLVSEVVTLEMTTAQVQATDAVAEKSLHCGCGYSGDTHLPGCPTAFSNLSLSDSTFAQREVMPTEPATGNSAKVASPDESEGLATLEEKARQFRLTHGPFNLEGVSGHASRWEDRYAAAFASSVNKELREELDHLRVRAFHHNSNTEHTSHTTACTVWREDGQGHAHGFTDDVGPCNCGALKNFERKRAEAAEKERDDLARESKLQSAEQSLREKEDATKFRQERDAAVNDCEALQIHLQQARQELAKANTRVRSERRKHIEAELNKP